MANFVPVIVPAYYNMEAVGFARTGDPSLGTPATEDLTASFFCTQDCRIEGLFLTFPLGCTVEVYLVNALDILPAVGPVSAGIINKISNDAEIAALTVGDIIIGAGRTLQAVPKSFLQVNITGGVPGVKRAVLKVTPLRGS